MRRYVVVRTDRTHKPFIFGEFREGRLRQGWGWPGYDLPSLRRKANENKRLDEDEISAWRNRRLLNTEADGLKPDDVVIVPNLPRDGHWVLARVAGPYRFEPVDPWGGGLDYGHIVPVEPLRDKQGRIAEVDPDNEHVDARLRATMRNMSRMWSVDSLAPAIDKLIAAIESGANVSSIQPEERKRLSFVEHVRAAAWEELTKRYRGAELERLVHWLLARLYPAGRVEHWGGRSEQGADLIVFAPDVLGLEFKIAVQVKMHDGVDDELRALDQIREARNAHRVDAGVVVTTAREVSDRFEKHRAALEETLGIDIRVLARDELLDLVLRHLDGGIDLPAPEAPVG